MQERAALVAHPQGRNTDPKAVVFAKLTVKDWSDLCHMLAEGVAIREACAELLIPYSTYRRAMRESPPLREQVDAAKGEWANRNWSEELVEEVVLAIAQGSSLEDVAKEKGFTVAAFYGLRLRDEYVHAMFARAREMQAEGYVDELIKLSDESGKDTVADGKGGQRSNGAAPQRSKLQVETRKWIAGKILARVYGDKAETQVNVGVVVNHADRLEAARTRRENAHSERAIQTVDVSSS